MDGIPKNGDLSRKIGSLFLIFNLGKVIMNNQINTPKGTNQIPPASGSSGNKGSQSQQVVERTSNRVHEILNKK